MVAEPVLATLGTLRLFYATSCDYLSAQHEKLPDSTSFWNSSWLPHFDSSQTQHPQEHAEYALSRITQKCKDYKTELLSAFTVGLGLAGYLYFQLSEKSSSVKRRRVPKLANGARRDVVLVVGSPTEPLTRLLALDFEKRGFIVYLTILDDKDLKYIQSNAITDDINYLNLTESGGFESRFAKFRKLLEVKVVPFEGAKSHFLRLSAVVFTPTLYFPLGPIENIPETSWNKMFARLAVYYKLFGSGLLDLVRDQKSKVVGIIPSIVSTLKMPYHAPETILQNSLKDLFTTLAKEVRGQGISVTQVRLGNLNLSSSRNLPASRATRVSSIVEAEVRSWSDEMRSVYGSEFQKAQAQSSPIASTFKTRGLRDLHHLLFDLIFHNGRNPSVVYYGAGARAYDQIASILPESVMELIT